ncbi:MAG TPA: deoxyribose-phosphate aldolase [Oscillatoriales cyanobacterium M59_W2019_021]|nr:MAG: deoxyribose-phosphate aldolase [Cyanobacteria bacterium J055]HIK29941.1 deoxyribose-phosphate aldolase [Oscillatoriales cyanobacterium M4454_W2019_049]HIK50187.1 deoxyribose-phosphate aldolase [Oscillatoriales cyanobacterium M59_W2019_021]
MDIDIAPYLDHSLLAPIATEKHVEQWCAEADRFGFASVCISPCYVRLAAELLHKKSPKVCTVIGFPMGATTSAVKLYEAREAVENGATELDVVINLAWLKMGNTEALHREIAEICEETNVTVKAILETNLLMPEEKRIATDVCLDAGVRFLKTCTGWNGGATVEDVKLLKELTKGRVGIKASGGIRTYEGAIKLILAGATRLGTSYSMELLRQRDRSAEEAKSDRAEPTSEV